MQRMEAKKANLDSILKRCEDDKLSKKWISNVLEDAISFAGSVSPRNNHKA